VKKRDKFGLVGVMSLGVFAAVASFVKGAYVHIMVEEDAIFDGLMLVFWSVCEPTLTIVAASIPVVRTFLRDLIHSLSARRVSRRVEEGRQQWQGDTGRTWASNNDSEVA